MSAEWLALREPADAAARARDLVARLPARERHVVHDLGCGTGGMGRWLAPLLSGPQHWVLHDVDEDLLDVAVANPPAEATVESAPSDVTRLDPGDLADGTLITASALLDVLTEEELERLVAACGGAGCPVLLTLSVVGEVQLTPPDPLDSHIAAAFNAHQRRMTGRGRLVGPDAPALAAEAFRRRGAEVLVRPSPWRLGPDHADLMAEWFAGWVGAAFEQEPGLAAGAAGYERRGVLEATVGHADLLVLPG